jgi:hypothetical protein
MKIKLEIYNESGFVRKEEIDLTNKFQDRGIQLTFPIRSYSATDPNDWIIDPQQGENNQFNAVSGGQILPMQSVNRINKGTDVRQMFSCEPTVNVKIRYDASEPKESRWNIDIYVDIDDPNLSWDERRLITKHPKHVHKVSDCKQIEVKSWIDGVAQEAIKSQRPSGF